MKILFESSYEVCNLVGGIHTVVSTKVNYVKKFVDRHILLGPWFRDRQKEFIQARVEEVPNEIQFVFNELSKKGIFCSYGWWDLPSKPEVVLIDANNLAEEEHKNYLKTKYWDLFKIDSLKAGWDFEEPMILSTAMGMFIEEFAIQNCSEADIVVAQFHEWMTGFGGLYLKSQKMDGNGCGVKSVFTTHATMLGRAFTGHGGDLSKLSKDFNALEEARKIGVVEKYSTELACAKFCDEFSTVSKITQSEAFKFFGIKPALTYNGMNIEDFVSGAKLLEKKKKIRSKILDVLKNYFPNEDLSHHLLTFTSGRPEFHNKGHDSILSAMKKCHDANLPVICMFLVPWQSYDLREELDISTHYIYEGANQIIIKTAKELGIDNKTKTKVIFYPCYVGSEEDILFDMPYYDLTTGFDLGIFASSYEPWGYTPMEALSCGTLATTSDLTGFGDYFKSNEVPGLYIIKKNESEVNNMFRLVSKLVLETKKDDLFLSAFSIAKKCSWNKFIKQYIKLYGF